MQIVPVIDLMGGQVVHARRGDRDHYQPLVSALCQGAAPQTVVAALLDLHAFEALYIADIDAIRARGDHCDLLRQLHRSFPALDLWVDAGIADRAGYTGLRAIGCTPIIGSESLRDVAWLRDIAPDDALLSLDHRGAERLGPTALWLEPTLWPRRVLAMNLHRVGAEGGPDLALIRTLQALHRDARIYAAGGVRHSADLAALATADAAGALLATALHSGTITKQDLRVYS